MHRRVVYLIAWAVATALTVGVAWLGIRSVLIAAAPTRSQPLSAADLRRIAPTPSATPAPVPPPTATSGAGRSATATATATWAPVEGGFRRTFRLTGGEVVAFAGNGAVQVQQPTPKDGYSVTVARSGGDSVTVTFSSGRKSSKVTVRWVNGPYAEVLETGL